MYLDGLGILCTGRELSHRVDLSLISINVSEEAPHHEGVLQEKNGCDENYESFF